MPIDSLGRSTNQMIMLHGVDLLPNQTVLMGNLSINQVRTTDQYLDLLHNQSIKALLIGQSGPELQILECVRLITSLISTYDYPEVPYKVMIGCCNDALRVMNLFNAARVKRLSRFGTRFMERNRPFQGL